MVPPPRNYAADAHECIMGSGRKARRIQGCGAMIGRPRHSSPRDFRLAEPMAAPRAPDIIVRRQPTRETSLVVSRISPREREGARMPMCASTKALGSSTSGGLCPHARGRGEDQARDGRNLGPPTSAADRRRWPDPCKGWPSATASGGFGLDKRLASDILRRQGFDGQERASSGPPTRLPGPDTTQIFPLTKKTSYKVGVGAVKIRRPLSGAIAHRKTGVFDTYDATFSREREKDSPAFCHRFVPNCHAAFAFGREEHDIGVVCKVTRTTAPRRSRPIAV